MSKTLNYFIAIVILLWPLTIAEDPPLGEGEQKTTAKKTPSKKEKKPTFAGKKYKQPHFSSQKPDYIDKDAFLLAFKRQAALSLLPCLNKWKKSPASLILKAYLTKVGKLTQVETAYQEEGLPNCAITAISAMSFEKLAINMPEEKQALQWKVSW